MLKLVRKVFTFYMYLALSDEAYLNIVAGLTTNLINSMHHQSLQISRFHVHEYILHSLTFFALIYSLQFHFYLN